jgi:hypothetical protein
MAQTLGWAYVGVHVDPDDHDYGRIEVTIPTDRTRPLYGTRPKLRAGPVSFEVERDAAAAAWWRRLAAAAGEIADWHDTRDGGAS